MEATLTTPFTGTFGVAKYEGTPYFYTLNPTTKAIYVALIVSEEGEYEAPTFATILAIGKALTPILVENGWEGAIDKVFFVEPTSVEALEATFGFTFPEWAYPTTVVGTDVTEDVPTGDFE